MNRRRFIKLGGYLSFATAATGCLNDRDNAPENGTRGARNNTETSGTEEVEPGEVIVREETVAESPYGDDIPAKRLRIMSTKKASVEVTVRNPDGEEIYHAEMSLHGSGELADIEIGRAGDYEINAAVNSEEYEGTWRVGRGFTDASVQVTDDGVEIGASPELGTLVLTRMSGHPDTVEPDTYTNVSEVEPFARAFDRLDDCIQDDSPEHCIHPPEDAWERLDNPDDHPTATMRVRGREFGTVLGYMVESGKESANLYRRDSGYPGYMEGYYIERDGEFYVAYLSSGLSASQPAGPF